MCQYDKMSQVSKENRWWYVNMYKLSKCHVFTEFTSYTRGAGNSIEKLTECRKQPVVAST